ncbi:peptidase S24/S26A/S26B/S26C, partial [Hysterangium stoloniferum]
PIVLFVKNYGLVPKYVTGRSMQPTLNPDSSRLRKDIALFDRSFLFTGYTFRKGDIIAIRSPVNPDSTLIKRIIALEGDEVETLPPYPENVVTVPEGHIWVEGDERFHSEDSNHFGPVPLGLVDSKLMFLVWPLDRFG